jgi:valyl-tRNA synthetase
MRHVLDRCLMLLHPFMPFVTEALWGGLSPRGKMLVHADWPEDRAADAVDPAAEAEMRWVVRLIEEVRSARAQMHVPVGLRVPMVHTGLDPDARAAWERNAAMIRRLARIESLTEVDALPKGAITVALPGASFGLPLADVIDVGAERARLEKALAKLEKEIGGLEKRLDNPKFLESAPEDVVDETRENLTERRAEADKIRAALARLAELA